MSNNIKVVCRFRPGNSFGFWFLICLLSICHLIVNKVELNQFPPDGKPVVNFSEEKDNVKLNSSSAPTSGSEANGYSFDRVFPMNTAQEEVCFSFHYSLFLLYLIGF